MIPLKANGRPIVPLDDMVVGYAKHDKGSGVISLVGSVGNSLAYLVEQGYNHDINDTPIVEYNKDTLFNISDGDILSISPSGLAHILFRTKSNHNALFITDRCNSNCLMCSQPPKDKDDLDYHFDINLQVVKLLPGGVGQLGITGGEPTLLGNRLFVLLYLLKEKHPDTYLHMLTNGRIFAWRQWVDTLAQINHPNLVLGIPLYSDYYAHHDYIVQAKNAFNQTILGLYNLARYNLRIELRVVLHKASKSRLVQLSKYIQKNLPFVEHVAFMGLEYTGYTPYNSSILWLEPEEYVNDLAQAVVHLDRFGINVSIYNLPLCLLPKELWFFARKSISDWKREYTGECARCMVADKCGGVFATSKRQSDRIKAIVST